MSQAPVRQFVLVLASLCVLNCAWGAATPAQIDSARAKIDSARAKSLAWLYTNQIRTAVGKQPRALRFSPRHSPWMHSPTRASSTPIRMPPPKRGSPMPLRPATTASRGRLSPSPTAVPMWLCSPNACSPSATIILKAGVLCCFETRL